jgi:hypothetical protein
MNDLGSMKLVKHKKGKGKGDMERFFFGRHFLAKEYTKRGKSDEHSAHNVTYALLYGCKDRKGNTNKYDDSDTVKIKGLADIYKPFTNFEFERIFDMSKDDRKIKSSGTFAKETLSKLKVFSKKQTPTTVNKSEMVDEEIKRHWNTLNIKGGILLHRITRIMMVEDNKLFIEYIDKSKENKKRKMHLSCDKKDIEKFYTFIANLLIVIAQVKSSRLNVDKTIVVQTISELTPYKDFVKDELGHSKIDTDKSDVEELGEDLCEIHHNNSSAAAAPVVAEENIYGDVEDFGDVAEEPTYGDVPLGTTGRISNNNNNNTRQPVVPPRKPQSLPKPRKPVPTPRTRVSKNSAGGGRRNSKGIKKSKKGKKRVKSLKLRNLKLQGGFRRTKIRNQK